jgi:heme exporter protein C
VGIVAFVDVPVVHFSVVWWRTLHQPASVLSPDPAPMDPRMAAALFVSVLAFTLAGLWVVRRRLRVLAAADARVPSPAAPGAPAEPLVVARRERP